MTTTTKKPVKPKFKVLSERFFNGKQSIEFLGLYEYKDNKLKIAIDKDSYDNQSSGVIYIFNPTENQWNQLEIIPYPMLCVVINKVSVYTKVKENGEIDALTRSTFNYDIKELQRLASLIL